MRLLGTAATQSSVRDVGHGFGHGAERWRGVDPAHGEHEWESDELGLPFVGWHEDGQVGCLGWHGCHAVESIVDVELGEVDGAKSRVAVVDAV